MPSRAMPPVRSKWGANQDAVRVGRADARNCGHAKEAVAAMTSRKVASTFVALLASDARDRRLMTDHTRRVSKALRVLSQAGRVVRATDDLGRIVWCVVR